MAENIDTISVETKLTRHQHHLDLLQTMITNINMSSEAAKESIDKQVDEICSRFKKLGEEIEEIKEENKKLRREEKKKVRKLVENSETVEDLKARKGRKAEVKLPIPDVIAPRFEEGEMEETQLLKLLRKLKMMKGPMFTASFNFDDVDLQSGKLLVYKYNIGGLLYSVDVQKDTSIGHHDSLYIYLKLTPPVKSSDVEFSVKLINHIEKSVEKHSSEAISASDGKGWIWPKFINWNKFSKKQNGFLTEDNKFTVQATVKVLKIEY